MQAFRGRRRRCRGCPRDAPGHEKNWLDAIRQKGQAVSHFDYAGPFTETVLLGNVALRYPGRAPDVGRGEHEGHQQARGRPVRRSTTYIVRAGRSAIARLRRGSRRRDRARGAPRARSSALLARGHEHRVRGPRRARRRALRRGGRPGGLRPRRSPRRRAEPLPAEQRHHPAQSPDGGRERARRRGRARMPAHRAARLRPDRRRVRHRDRHRAAVARDRRGRVRGPRDGRWRPRRSRRHRQGLRGGPGGGAARGVGPRARVRPRRLQLRRRPRAAGGRRRLAADAERSARALAGLLPALDASGRAQRVRRPEGRPHPGSADGRARCAGGSPPGWRCRGRPAGATRRPRQDAGSGPGSRPPRSRTR